VAARIQVTFVISIQGRPCAPDCPSQASNAKWEGTGSAKEPISSTEPLPMPQALRRARLTARVSAPWTREETAEGSA
jgi:hypothetical protein